MATPPPSRHPEEVARAVEAGAAAHSPVVASWTRSSKLHSLSPERDVSPERVADTSLAREREALGRLLEAAQPSLDQVFELVGNAGCSVVMASSTGVVIDRRGKVADDDTFKSWGLWTGAVWTERSQGTNAIGTSLVEQRPVMIHRDEHFLNRNTILSCMTAPVHGELGGLAAVIDVSSARSDLTEDFAKMIFTIACDAARRIETQNFNMAFAGARMVMLGDQARVGPALLAIDKHDIVIGATHAARRSLGLALGGQIEGIPAPELLGRQAQDVDSLGSAEHGVLLRAMQRYHHNMTKTAKALGLSRATLYRKLHQHGIAIEK